MKIRLLAFGALALTMACEGSRAPTGPAAPGNPSEIILDGAHGGNRDFFFLPPLVPIPVHNPDFELGKFNNTLKTSLKIEICELNADHLKTGGLPTELTTCGAIKKTFAPGSVNLVNLPLRQNGWWTLFNLPPDGFYYVLWDTRQSNLSVNKYYRIKVFIDGNTTPLGVADVDPMSSLLQWKYSLTGEVIQMVDDVLLPIPFRVERGGGSTLCGGATVCASATISNNSSTPQVLTVDGGAGAIAGAQFPNGWLPATGPQNVVVTIAQVDLGSVNPSNGTETNPCHVGLPLQQFPGCFRFTTTPALQPIDESGRQFATPVIAAVCFSLFGTGDPRAQWVEMYGSGPNEPAHALEDASDVGILSPATRNCNTSTEVITSVGGNGLTRFASSAWRNLRSGAGRLFGVKTAYAIDLGLGGFLEGFTSVGPALSATIQPVGATTTNLTAGGTVQPFVRIVGTNHHDGHHHNDTGIAGLPVTFTVTSGPNTLSPQGESGGTASQLVATTSSAAIDPESPTSGGGYATVNWTLPTPTAVGTYTYTITASGPALGGPVVFTYVVTIANLPDFVISSAAPTIAPATATFAGTDTVTVSAFTVRNNGGPFGPAAFIGFYLSNDAVITSSDLLLNSDFGVCCISNDGTVTIGPVKLAIPARPQGVYYIGVLIDMNNVVPESNEGNNTAAIPLVVVGPDFTDMFLASNERRMLSMQTGATWRATITPSSAQRLQFVWTSPDANNVSISAGDGYVDVHAIVGGENINAAAEAHVDGFYPSPTGEGTIAGTSLEINSFSFDIIPRNTSVAWNAVPGAVAYHVVVEAGNGSDPTPPFCSVPSTCTTWGVISSAYTTGLTHFFIFVGAQPGRWRVFAIGADGSVINTSPYAYFDYDI